MKFSLWLFKDWYEQHGISLSSFVSDAEAEIDTITLLSHPEDDAIDSHTACIYPGEALDNCSGFRSALCFGSDRLLFPVAAPETIFNLGLELMESFSRWELDLQEQIFNDVPVTSILSSMQSHFPFPLAIWRRNTTVSYHSDNWRLTLDTETNRRLLSLLQHSGLPQKNFFLTSKQDKIYTLIGRAAKETDSKWCLLACDDDNRLTPGDTCIFEAVCHIVSLAVSYHDTRSSYHPMSRWYAEQLQRKSRYDSQSAPTASCGWNPDDFYLIACIQADEIQTSCYPELIQSLSSSDFCCIQIAESISVLIHLGHAFPSDLSQVRDRITTQCDRFRVKTGTSLVFRGLDHILEFHTQSLWAVREAQDRKVSFFSIESALPGYLLQCSKSIPEIHAYIHPEIQKLASTDSSGSDDLLRTLYTYLILGRSASRTADALFIHRNTLRNRLNKIREIMSLDFEDESQFEHILLSLIILPEHTA